MQKEALLSHFRTLGGAVHHEMPNLVLCILFDRKVYTVDIVTDFPHFQFESISRVEHHVIKVIKAASLCSL